MNAYELYDAVFDSARAEWIPESREEQIEDVISYADGAFNLNISHAVATQIIDARESLSVANGENGEWENNLWHCVEKQLSEIEL